MNRAKYKRHVATWKKRVSVSERWYETYKPRRWRGYSQSHRRRIRRDVARQLAARIAAYDKSCDFDARLWQRNTRPQRVSASIPNGDAHRLPLQEYTRRVCLLLGFDDVNAWYSERIARLSCGGYSVQRCAEEMRIYLRGGGGGNAMRKLATSQTLERLERYINEFWCSTNYRVNPETLKIYVATDSGEYRCDAPKNFSVIPYKSGYQFVHNEQKQE